MLNQERVREMARLAMFDRKEGEACKPMMQYFRSDYVAKEVLKSSIYGTIAFGILLAAGVLNSMDSAEQFFNVADIQMLAVQIAKYYGVFMAVYLFLTVCVYQRKYTLGRRKIKEYQMHIRTVNRQYRQEEEM